MLILNGASPAGSVAIQLAMMGGVKVLTTAASAEELLYLQNFQPSIGTYLDTHIWSMLVMAQVKLTVICRSHN